MNNKYCVVIQHKGYNNGHSYLKDDPLKRWNSISYDPSSKLISCEINGIFHDNFISIKDFVDLFLYNYTTYSHNRVSNFGLSAPRHKLKSEYEKQLNAKIEEDRYDNQNSDGIHI